MGRKLSAREVGRILAVSSKTVRDWANEGVLPGTKTDNGPGKECWEFDEDEIYCCPDPRVTNRLKPAEVSGRRNAQQHIADLEKEIEDLKASLKTAESSLQSEREDKEKAIAQKVDLQATELEECRERTRKNQEACLAAEGALRAAVEKMRLKRDVGRLFRQAGIRVEYEMTEEGAAWNLRYLLKGENAWYRMEEYAYKPDNPLRGLHRYLLSGKAGAFRGCRNPSQERLQARRALYGMRLWLVVVPLVILGTLALKSFGVLTAWPALVIMGSVVAAAAVVNFLYGVRIEILRHKESKSL